LGDERVLDTMVCECCQTDAVMTKTGIAVVYRDRTDEAVRDISIVRLVNGKWSDPRTVFNDNWKIAGCPVNGPAIDAIGDTLAIAWYTEAEGKPQVKAVFSNDAGETFSQPAKIDEGKPLGRVDICLLSGMRAIVSWMESEESAAQIRTRFITQKGENSPANVIAGIPASRASGFPVMECANGKVIMAWTVPDSVSSIVKSVMFNYPQ
jgi:hypothetical protein